MTTYRTEKKLSICQPCLCPGWARLSFMFHSLYCLCGLLLDLYICTFLVLEHPKLDTALQLWPCLCWAEAKGDFSWLIGNALPNIAQDSIGLFWPKGALLAHCQEKLVFFQLTYKDVIETMSKTSLSKSFATANNGGLLHIHSIRVLLLIN